MPSRVAKTTFALHLIPACFKLPSQHRNPPLMLLTLHACFSPQHWEFSHPHLHPAAHRTLPHSQGAPRPPHGPSAPPMHGYGLPAEHNSRIPAIPGSEALPALGCVAHDSDTCLCWSYFSCTHRCRKLVQADLLIFWAVNLMVLLSDSERMPLKHIVVGLIEWLILHSCLLPVLLSTFSCD